MNYIIDSSICGETEFANQNVIAKHKTGTAIIWSNTEPNGIDLDKEAFHSGLSVIEGEKDILLIWLCEKPLNFKMMTILISYLIL